MNNLIYKVEITGYHPEDEKIERLREIRRLCIEANIEPPPTMVEKLIECKVTDLGVPVDLQDQSSVHGHEIIIDNIQDIVNCGVTTISVHIIHTDPYDTLDLHIIKADV